MRFSEKLTRLMAQRRLTQGALAAALDVSQPSVGRWLNDAKPHRGTALLLSEYFKVPVEDLLDDSKALPLDRYFTELKEVTNQVQEAYPENKDAAMHAMDFLLMQKANHEAAKRLRKLAEELASIAGILDGK